MSSDFTVKLNRLLTEYVKEVDDKTRRVMKEVADQAVEKLKNTSPKKVPGGGKYARGWRAKKDGKDIIVNNATDYQLTHLLENGHVVRNQYGTYERAEAIPHIKPVEEWANVEVEQEIRRELER